MKIISGVYGFIVLLCAISGNAQLFGFDLVSTIFFPTLTLLLIVSSNRRLSEISLAGYFLFSILLLACLLKATNLGIPYFDDYWIWPLKAMILAGFIMMRPNDDWGRLNHYAFLGMCLILIAVARFEDGRMYSIFGPNMLYRIFGLFYVLSIAEILRGKVLLRIEGIILAIFGALAALATGSVTALLVLCVPLIFLVERMTIKLLFVLFIGILLVLGFVLLVDSDSIPFVSRLLYKSEDVSGSERLVGWVTILSYPVTLFGYGYLDFHRVWSFGYEYPHNILVELYAYYGLIGAILVLVIGYSIVFFKNRISPYYLMFFTIFVGSLFSGDLSDNYAVPALAVGLIGGARNLVGLRNRIRN